MNTTAHGGTPPKLLLPFDLAALDVSPIRTARLVLRPIRARDADDIHAYQRLPEVVAYLPWPLRDREASHEHTELRTKQRALAADGDGVALAIVLPGEPGIGGGGEGRVIGDLTLILTSAAHAQVAVGWVLHPDFQGQGYAREAATALLDLATGLGAHRIAASVDTANEPSQALCERLGLRKEATFHHDRHDGTGWRDTVIYALTDAEWLARRTPGADTTAPPGAH
ncbi:GNAT family N-acetyltransferase [Nonomuraea jiangxiensis]|uniref:Protein N-acetyltransferase, RimJ/RimL family n=1 Tax=Nonomuraea jiangxiensis TaxID=633440 RepID=A0A1G9MQE1_9ACTN|nr:GNAT family protein [Nonomuraea jiangxiensis]SDL76439.1 Protein N-acetyltransferase, RimJ/RimL family [Nonomuraea jiangxiensis]